MQLALVGHSRDAPEAGEDVAYTPLLLATQLAKHLVADIRGRVVLEGHVGGGAWARAIGEHSPARLLGMDIDPAAEGLALAMRSRSGRSPPGRPRCGRPLTRS